MRAWLIISVFALVVVGLVTLLSTSYLKGVRDAENGFVYLQKQVLWVCFSFLMMFLVSNVPVEKIYKLSFPILILSVLFLIAVLIPGVGTEYNGARRWFRFFGLGFQPSEFAKLALILFLSSYISKKKEEIKKSFWAYFQALFVILIVSFLIFFEPDLGNSIFTFAIGMIALFIGGVRLVYIVPTVFLCLFLLFSIALFKFEYIKKRMPGVFGGGQNIAMENYQIKQSMIAIGSGGVFGESLGRSKQKLQYLPESHSDFSLSLLCEEMGFCGFIGVILLFALFFYSGLKIAVSYTDFYSRLFSLTLLLYIWMQLIINLGVISGVLPTKGINTPFLGYGGSNLFFIMCGIGILINSKIKIQAPNNK